MQSHFIVAAAAAMLLGFSLPATAQSSGEYSCLQDLERISDMYREKQASLTEAERQEAQSLLAVARSKCSATGQNALDTRSTEASALIEKLENAPAPSQAAAPRSR